MKTWNVVLATLVIFIAGIVTGALLVMLSTRVHGHPRRPAAAMAPAHVSAGTNTLHDPARLVLPFGISAKRGTPKEFLDRLDGELKLTPDQRAQIGKILDDGQQHAAQIWQTIAPEIREEMKSAREKIRETLTPDQRTRYEELMKFRPAKGPENPPSAVPATNAPAETPSK